MADNSDPNHDCKHPGLAYPYFDYDRVKAENMDAYRVREVYPRKFEKCNDCGDTVIMYASYLHYICGDW